MTELVAFDLDGTLLDTAQDFLIAVNTLRQNHGIGKAKFSEVRSRVSEGAISLAAYAMNIDNYEALEEEKIKDGAITKDKYLESCKLELLDIYKKCSLEKTTLFNDIDSVLIKLNEKNICWGIVTNKPRFFAEEIVEATLSKYAPTFLICPEDTGKRKPSPEGLILACKKANALPKESIYVGDHSVDIIAGREAGMKTIAAAYGYLPLGEDIEDWKANFVINSPLEILDFI